MSYSLTFARHFSRLLWLLLNEEQAVEAQIATLRALVALTREGAVTLSTQDWRLAVNGALLPERFTGAQDLTAQLIGHSVQELTADQHATPADLLCVLRLLANEPVPADGGRGMRSRLQALEPRTVHVRVAACSHHLAEPVPAASQPAAPAAAAAAHSLPATPLPPRESTARAPLPPAGDAGDASDARTSAAPPASQSRLSGTAAGNGAADAGGEAGALAAPELVREQDPDTLFHTFSSMEAPKGSLLHLIKLLDAARTDSARIQQLDAIVKLASESAVQERHDIAAEAFAAVVHRETAATDRNIRRLFGMAVRRLARPQVLQSVAALLPRRRESHAQYMAILARAEDEGVEALVDALISAPSLTDRRIYFDALLQLNTGVRTMMYMLGDPRWYVVRNAAELLGEMRVTEAEGELARLLHHSDDRVRTAAAASLAKLGTSAAVKGMRTALRDASATDVRERAAEAMGGARGPRSADTLIRSLDREQDAATQMAIVAALGQLGTSAAIAKLIDVASEEGRKSFSRRPTSVRVAAVHALGDAQGAEATAALERLSRARQKEIRGAASWVLMGRTRKATPTP